jgi:CRISPR-associated protein Csd1
MGLLQRAVETYDAHQHLVGKNLDGHETLAPICHIVTRADLEITLDETGSFSQARAVDKSEPKILMPVTADSGGRTSSPCAHPLCDQLAYVAPYDEKRHPLYVHQLELWAASLHSHPFLLPILQTLPRFPPDQNRRSVSSPQHILPYADVLPVRRSNRWQWQRLSCANSTKRPSQPRAIVQ